MIASSTTHTGKEAPYRHEPQGEEHLHKSPFSYVACCIGQSEQNQSSDGQQHEVKEDDAVDHVQQLHWSRNACNFVYADASTLEIVAPNIKYGPTSRCCHLNDAPIRKDVICKLMDQNLQNLISHHRLELLFRSKPSGNAPKNYSPIA